VVLSGSYGNGAAMRVAPIGAYFANDIKQVIENARQSSVVTHTHPNGIAGAIAIAVGAAQAYQFAATGTKPDADTFWQVILKAVPAGELNNKLQVAASLTRDTTTEQAAKMLGCGWDVSAIDTVPFALWCAIKYLDNFEEALWQTISVGGDADTTGAMVGGIVASYGGQSCIPQAWIERCEALPEWALGDRDDS
jgi:ADP-ribosylglycohydrolase